MAAEKGEGSEQEHCHSSVPYLSALSITIPTRSPLLQPLSKSRPKH